MSNQPIPGIHPAKKPMEGGFSLDKFASGMDAETAQELCDFLDKMDEIAQLEASNHSFSLQVDELENERKLLHARIAKL